MSDVTREESVIRDLKNFKITSIENQKYLLNLVGRKYNLSKEAIENLKKEHEKCLELSKEYYFRTREIKSILDKAND